MRFFVGAYTADMQGAASGVAVVRAGESEGPLAGGPLALAGEAVAVEGSPSWLAWHPTLDVLYAALEGAGAVQAFRRIGPESFAAVGTPVAVGEVVCHIAVEPGGRWLVASCWGDGKVVRVRLDEAGVPRSAAVAEGMPRSHAEPGMDAASDLRALLATLDSADAEADSPHEPDDDGQLPSRAHHARFLAGGAVATTDLGRDEVRFWHPAGGTLREVDRVALPAGTGPRHSVWHPSGHLYVVTESSLELFVLAPPAGGGRGWRVVGGTPLSPAVRPGSDFAAEITLTREAEHVHVGVRGSNAIAALRVRGSGAELTPVALAEAGVDWPRHHVVVRDTLLVAGQRSDAVVSLALDVRTGVPGRVRHRVEVRSPAMLLADRTSGR